MANAHLFDANALAWTEHPQFPGLFIKVLETRATHPAASITLTRLDPGQTIGTHVHALETETAYLLAGQGQLMVDGQPTDLAAGMGVTIPPGIVHSLHNPSDAPLELIAIHTPPVR